jgi:hypothetical protein
LFVSGTSIEEVRAKVEKDVYWTGNVVRRCLDVIRQIMTETLQWDKEKLVIAPFLTTAE